MTNQKQKHNPSPKVKSTPGLLGACRQSLADFYDLLRLHGGILDQELALNIHGSIQALTDAIAKAEGGE